MRLKLAVPAEWPRRQVTPELSEIAVPAVEPGAAGLVLRVVWQSALPIGFVTWIEDQMREDTPVGTQLRQVAYERTQCAEGWPLGVLRYAVVDEAGRTVEERVGAFYRFLFNAASVIARFRDAAAYEARAAQLATIFTTATVEWPNTDTGCLKELLAH